MPLSLEELKQQRAQIQQHLDWLDAKIAEQQHLKPKTEAEKNTTPVESPKTSAESETSTEPTEVQPDPQPNLHTDLPAEIADIDAPTYKAKTQDEIMRAKIGCLALFILSIVLFLFLLFGLPYLL
jgi:hypothetical protein